MPHLRFVDFPGFDAIEIELTDEKVLRIRTALTKLQESHPDAQINGLEHALLSNPVVVSIEMISQLSKYCHTGGSWTRCIPYAEYLSRLLVGMVSPRLVDVENRRLPNYLQDVEQIRSSIQNGSHGR